LFGALSLLVSHRRLFTVAIIIKPATLLKFHRALIQRIDQFDNGILIADYVNPNIAEGLRGAKVQFLDTAGNAFIKQPGLHIQIKGNRPTGKAVAGPRKVARAFTTAGLKVTLALLQQPEIVDMPYRKIAELTGVTLGTVGKAMEDLKEQGSRSTQKRASANPAG
jgi:hypothetical protein